MSLSGVTLSEDQLDTRAFGTSHVFLTMEEKAAWLKTRAEELRAVVEGAESDLRNGMRLHSKPQVEAAIQTFNELYTTFIDDIASRSIAVNTTPSDVLDFNEEHKAKTKTDLEMSFEPIAETNQLVDYVLDTFIAVKHIVEPMNSWEAAPDLNPGVVAATVQSAYDDHISSLIDKHTQRSAQRNEQLKVIDRHVLALHRQITSGVAIDPAVAKTHLEALDGVKDDLIEEYPELAEYFDLPKVTDETDITEDFIRDYMAESDMLKARLHSSHSEHANEINKLHQLYILVIDVMKNMQKMQQDATSAIIRRTGQ